MNALKSDRSRIENLDAQILQLERALSALRGKRALVQERLDSYKYPVLNLPNEIVSEVFIHFLPPYPEPPPSTGIFSPTLLAQICRKWRGIALSTPELWRAMKYSSEYPIAAFPDWMETWLERSRACPLSLEILEYAPRADNLARILELVILHRARWEHLKFHSFKSSELLGLDGPMPLLRRLNVTFHGGDTRAFPLLPDAPLLRTAVLDYIALAAVILPWGQLTSLTLERVFPSDCTAILKQSTNLIHCRLTVVDGESVEPAVTLSRLDSLVFEDYDYSLVTGHLETFIVPALRHLEVPEIFLGSTPIVSLQFFISQSGCQLQDVLITQRHRVPEADYREVFPSIPSLRFESIDLED